MSLLARLLFAGGLVHLSILAASALVPFRLELAGGPGQCLPRLHLQMYWTYGGYVVLSIVAFGLISVTDRGRTGRPGRRLARGFCGYVFVFWADAARRRKCVFDARPHLTAWWLPARVRGR